MLLPYASDQPPTQRPIATWSLLGVNIALTLFVFVSDRIHHGSALAILNMFGIVPAHFRLFSLVTYSFFHEGWGHLLTNLFYLWVFGGGVEAAVGWRRYLLLYILGGAFGGILQFLVTNALLTTEASAPIVGASAACASLIGLFAMRYYRTRLSFIGLPWRPHVVSVITVFLAFEIITGLWHVAAGSGAQGVANWAHIGGFVFGLAWAQIFHLGDEGERAYLRQDAAKAMDKSVPGAAIRRWETLLAREPGSMTARAELARAWLMLGDSEQAATNYVQAIEGRLERNQRVEAAKLFAEMHEHGLEHPLPAEEHLFALGAALEESEQYALAAETLRAVILRAPESPESEMALLKVIGLYVHQLGREEEARGLLRLFLERYPESSWRAHAITLCRPAP